MASMEISSRACVKVAGSGTSYAAARAANAGFQINACWVGQYYASPDYTINRTAFEFDTSVLAGLTLTKANVVLTLLGYGNSTGTDFNVYVVKATWEGDLLDSHASEDGIFTGAFNAIDDASNDALVFNTVDWVNSKAYTSGDLDLTRINKSGITQYGFISDRDQAETEPSGSEYFYAVGSAKLIVEYGGIVPRRRTLLGVGL